MGIFGTGPKEDKRVHCLFALSGTGPKVDRGNRRRKKWNQK